MPEHSLSEDVVALVRRLPPMPGTMAEMNGVRDPEALTHIRRIARKDPGVCTELLHLANAALPCGQPHCETVEDALSRVDPADVETYFVTSYARAHLTDVCKGVRHLGNYFAHSQEISAAAAALACEAGELPGQCRMYAAAGLIHDIGRLIMMLAAGERTAPLLGTSWREMLSVVEDEREVLGLDHTEVGMHLCRKWHFTDVMAEGVRRHHTPVAHGFSRPGAFLFLAHFLGFKGADPSLVLSGLPDDFMAQLNLDERGFAAARKRFLNQQESGFVPHQKCS